MNRLSASGSRLWASVFGIPRIVVLALLRGYKFAVSPMFPPACRYVPTCSEYAVEAVQRHGALRGSVLAVWRVLCCHPFVRGGYDPVPWKEVIAKSEASLRWTGEAPVPTRSSCTGHPHTKNLHTAH
jgi:putative membrane protein insertion efficiency factor